MLELANTFMGHDWLASTTTQAVAWALIHFLWQGTLVALVLRSLLASMPEQLSNGRYALSLLALLVMAILPVVTAWQHVTSAPAVAPTASLNEMTLGQGDANTPRGHSSHRVGFIAPASASTSAAEDTTWRAGTLPNMLQQVRHGLNPRLPWVLAFWLCGVALFSFQQLMAWRHLRRLVHTGDQAEGALQGLLSSLMQRLDVRRPVQVMSSHLVTVPTVIGALKPVILVPFGTMARLTSEEVEMILAHELAHIRRHDVGINLAQVAVETLLFYHPAVWWVSAQVRREREHCCDDVAVSLWGDSRSYARALLNLEESRSAPSLAMAANGTPLLTRVRRLLGAEAESRQGLGSTALAGGLSLTILGAVLWMTHPVMGGPVAPAAPVLPTPPTVAEVPVAPPAAPAPLDLPVPMAPKVPIAPQDAPTVTAPPNVPDPVVAPPNVPDPVVAPPTVAPPAPVSRPGFVRPAVVAPAISGPALLTLPMVLNATDDMGEPLPSRGRFTMERRRGEVVLQMRGNESKHRFSIHTSLELTEFSQAAWNEGGQATLGREAGELIFEGSFSAPGEGDGTFRFEPSPAFQQAMKSRGYEDINPSRQFELALHNVTTTLVDDMASLGFNNLGLERLVELAIHEVDADFIRSFEAVGYRNLDIETWIAFKIHDVSPDYVETMVELGYQDISAERLVELNIHDVNPEFIRSVESMGFEDLSIEKLIELSIHDVNPEFMESMAAMGFNDLPIERLIELSIHDVQPEFVEAMAAAGYRDLDSDRLIELAIHDVDPEFVASMAAAGYADLPIERLIELAIHDVDPRLVSSLEAAGYGNLPAERLVELSIHDVDAELIDALKRVGYSNLPVEKLTEFAIHDVTPSFIEDIAALGYDDLTAEELVEFRIFDISASYIRRLQDDGESRLTPQQLVERRIHGSD